ncbi:hypothetical protein [Puniceibacterium sp. IMCC21224]|uniref:hypothetical protein n=1 Tax=Puniceibacterium sp. IMCC21224 TaxID=1618204 RepID=UPI00064DBF86|nr:hypothetical protein [Puniceibacterium sp. IMCC21224]KMK67248.1 hypothetical protein IMCC21224_112115 [Puniceibacterium sp. IMCC21224]
MVKPLLALTISALVLGSCGTVRESRVNPFNWFGRGQSEPVSANADSGNPLIPARSRSLLNLKDNEEVEYAGQPIAEVSELLIERRPGGAIIRATGVASQVGPFDVRLIPVPDETDLTTLSYSLRALQQPGPRSTGPGARSVIVAIWLTDQEMAGITAIRVSGQSNTLASRR